MRAVRVVRRARRPASPHARLPGDLRSSRVRQTSNHGGLWPAPPALQWRCPDLTAAGRAAARWPEILAARSRTAAASSAPTPLTERQVRASEGFTQKCTGGPGQNRTATAEGAGFTVSARAFANVRRFHPRARFALLRPPDDGGCTGMFAVIAARCYCLERLDPRSPASRTPSPSEVRPTSIVGPSRIGAVPGERSTMPGWIRSWIGSGIGSGHECRPSRRSTKSSRTSWMASAKVPGSLPPGYRPRSSRPRWRARQTRAQRRLHSRKRSRD